MKVEYAGQSDVGRKRGHNEDYFLILEEHNLFIVADGMGGHSSGEVASKMAAESVSQFFVETAEDEDVTWPFKLDRGISYEENRLGTGVKLANLRIHECQAANPAQRGMGTTFVGAYFVRDTIIIGHVGDSRVYRLRGDNFEQLTEDHSLLNDWKKMKQMTEEEIAKFPHKNVIMRALGMKDTVQVDVLSHPTEPGDLFLLCSDGLSGMSEDPELKEILLEHGHDLEAACQALTDSANNNGGQDNITSILVRVL